MLSSFAIKALSGLGLTGIVVTATALSIPKSKDTNSGLENPKFEIRNDTCSHIADNNEWNKCEDEKARIPVFAIN